LRSRGLPSRGCARVGSDRGSREPEQGTGADRGSRVAGLVKEWEGERAAVDGHGEGWEQAWESTWRADGEQYGLLGHGRVKRNSL